MALTWPFIPFKGTLEGTMGTWEIHVGILMGPGREYKALLGCPGLSRLMGDIDMGGCQNVGLFLGL